MASRAREFLLKGKWLRAKELAIMWSMSAEGATLKALKQRLPVRRTI